MYQKIQRKDNNILFICKKGDKKPLLETVSGNWDQSIKEGQENNGNGGAETKYAKE